jgi:hypothetical protein
MERRDAHRGGARQIDRPTPDVEWLPDGGSFPRGIDRDQGVRRRQGDHRGLRLVERTGD